jgi:dGTP triphosphohydrolase
LDGNAILDWNLATSDEQRMRVIVDFVANLTDLSAERMHDRLVNQRRISL